MYTSIIYKFLKFLKEDDEKWSLFHDKKSLGQKSQASLRQKNLNFL